MQAQNQNVSPFIVAYQNAVSAKTQAAEVIHAVMPYLFDVQGSEVVAKQGADVKGAKSAVEATGLNLLGIAEALKHTRDNESATAFTFVSELSNLLAGRKPSSLSSMAWTLKIANTGNHMPQRRLQMA